MSQTEFKLNYVPAAPEPLVSVINRNADHQVQPVVGLCVHQTPIVSILRMYLEIPAHSNQTEIHGFCLSLPAAARLARSLEEAVQKHLHGEDVDSVS